MHCSLRIARIKSRWAVYVMGKSQWGRTQFGRGFKLTTEYWYNYEFQVSMGKNFRVVYIICVVLHEKIILWRGSTYPMDSNGWCICSRDQHNWIRSTGDRRILDIAWSCWHSIVIWDHTRQTHMGTQFMVTDYCSQRDCGIYIIIVVIAFFRQMKSHSHWTTFQNTVRMNWGKANSQPWTENQNHRDNTIAWLA